MLLLLSPSKTLDFETPFDAPHSQPDHLNESLLLIKELRKYTPKKLSALMDISDKLAALNVDRYQSFNVPFTVKNARQAIAAFKGDVYEPMEVASYSKADLEFAQQHVRILSGLYGLLRPLDLMQPYRLEMGTGLKNPRGKDLYAFWGNRITDALNDTVKSHKNKQVINLASVEYFHSVKPALLSAPLLTVTFKERHKGSLKIIGLMAKRARGMMADFIIRHRVDRAEGLKDFDREGYGFQPSLSDAGQWVFTRG